MPEHLAKRYTPTSPIYEFSFDFNKLERRADAKVAIRMDITNVKGYWDGLVDSPGVNRRDVERRYFSALNLDWKKTFQKGDTFEYGSGESSLKVQKDLSTPVFWQAAENCPVGDKDYGEGIAAFIKGKVDADLYYAATVIVSIPYLLSIFTSILLKRCCRQPQPEVLRMLTSRKPMGSSKSLAKRI
jgi:chitinase